MLFRVEGSKIYLSANFDTAKDKYMDDNLLSSMSTGDIFSAFYKPVNL